MTPSLHTDPSSDASPRASHNPLKALPSSSTKEVEEAIKCMEQNAPWGYDDDGPQERQEHETHMAALAVIKAALASQEEK